MRNRLLLAVFFGAIVVNQGMRAASPNPWEDNPSGNAGALKGQIETAGSYDAQSGNATRIVNDLKSPGALGEYGLDFTRYWNSTHNDYDNPFADWSTDFGMSGWSHSWHWAAVEGHEGEDPIPGSEQSTPVRKTSITITFPDGHTAKYQIMRCWPRRPMRMKSWTASR
jgi:hypothetical protein